MSHEEVAEMLGAFALDAVDPDERVLVEDHLADCARCRAEYEGYREVTGLLAAGGAAPEGAWDRIAGSLHEPPPPLALKPHRTWSRPAGALVAAPAIPGAPPGMAVRRPADRLTK